MSCNPILERFGWCIKNLIQRHRNVEADAQCKRAFKDLTVVRTIRSKVHTCLVIPRHWCVSFPSFISFNASL